MNTEIKTRKMNLNELIEYYNINMILNNDVLPVMAGTYEIEEINNNLYDYFDLEDVEYYLNEYYDEDVQVNEDNLEDVINQYFEELQQIYYETCEVYQYYIINDDGAYFFKKYTDYPIYYIEELDLHMVGITHYGMAWEYFETKKECYEQDGQLRAVI